MKTQNFHLPLPAGTYAELRQAAEDLGTPATQIARAVLEAWLKDRRKRSLHKDISKYAEAHAGSSFDLDLDFEAASIGHLLTAAEDTSSPQRAKKRSRKSTRK
jgi:hypothetical protein